MNDADKENWRPSAGPRVARSRAAMLKRARDFFAARDVLEVDTPQLNAFAVTDPHIESLAVHPSDGTCRYLHTSPEYRMKRLLAAGFGDIYQICKVFRDAETGRRHAPEFTMVEWYRLGFGLQEIIDDTVEFIAAALDRRELARSAERVSYSDAFSHRLDIDVLKTRRQDLAQLAGADAQLQESVGDDLNAWLDLLFASRIAAGFATDRLTVVFHYPASQAALARKCPDDDELADRFEIFLGSIELANGFVELTDAQEQLARFENDNAIRRRLRLTEHRIDARLIAALEAGLPACAGVAVGFERLLMQHEGTDDIGNVVSFAD